MPGPKTPAPGAPARALVLFDIDGTLIRRAGPHHRQALVEAVRRVTGLETTTDDIPVQGMLDPDILSLMMRQAGATAAQVRRAMPELVQTAQSIYVTTCPKLERRVCPGVRSLLETLEQLNIPVGLVTGNLTEIAWKKMEHAGLRRFFRFGAFSESAKDRAGLVRLAIGHARREGWIDRRSVVSLIGDHPNDIRAARANGIRAVAVATGVEPEEILERETPDVLVRDLRCLRVESLLAQD